MSVRHDGGFSEAQDGIAMLEIDVLDNFEGHPFKTYEGERLSEMVQSIKEFGIISPIIVRPKVNARFEILSGHNRVKAAKISKITSVPAFVMTDISDEEANLIVTETNLIQRSFNDLVHSEKALVLKRHRDALKEARGGKGRKIELLSEIESILISSENEQCVELGLIVPKSNSRKETADKFGIDARSVSRYIRLNFLIESLLERVDADEIGLYPAVSLSFISKDEQVLLDKVLNETQRRLDIKKSELLRTLSKNKQFTYEEVKKVITGRAIDSNKIPPPLKINHDIYSKYFKEDVKHKEIENIIVLALDEYFAKRDSDNEIDDNSPLGTLKSNGLAPS